MPQLQSPCLTQHIPHLRNLTTTEFRKAIWKPSSPVVLKVVHAQNEENCRRRRSAAEEAKLRSYQPSGLACSGTATVPESDIIAPSTLGERSHSDIVPSTMRQKQRQRLHTPGKGFRNGGGVGFLKDSHPSWGHTRDRPRGLLPPVRYDPRQRRLLWGNRCPLCQGRF